MNIKITIQLSNPIAKQFDDMCNQQDLSRKDYATILIVR